MTRPLSAHIVPSAVMLGIAMCELVSILVFMIGSRRETWGTAICGLSVVGSVLVMTLVVVEASILDMIVSPYAPATDTPVVWQAKMTIAGFAVNILATLVMLGLFLARLRVFHRKGSRLFVLMAFVALATFLFSVPANVVAIITNLEVIQGKAKTFAQSSWINISNALFAATHVLEGIFSAACSLSFLWAIGKALGLSKRDFMTEMARRREGVRFMIIFGLNLLVAAFTLHAYIFGYNYVTFTVYYAPVMIYAIEIHTFMIASYEAPREFIERNLGGGLTPSWSTDSESRLKPDATPPIKVGVARAESPLLLPPSVQYSPPASPPPLGLDRRQPQRLERQSSQRSSRSYSQRSDRPYSPRGSMMYSLRSPAQQSPRPSVRHSPVGEPRGAWADSPKMQMPPGSV
ncbi:hypothetical protein HK105_207933 [Polyrhizophydium stewartii]|uniref:Uncharacterized protein n=1 Tax=Polyrhizophydium stewartii TaxID=2732419 RepID=A0ABR4MZ63_9FUNG